MTIITSDNGDYNHANIITQKRRRWKEFNKNVKDQDDDNNNNNNNNNNFQVDDTADGIMRPDITVCNLYLSNQIYMGQHDGRTDR